MKRQSKRESGILDFQGTETNIASGYRAAERNKFKEVQKGTFAANTPLTRG